MPSSSRPRGRAPFVAPTILPWATAWLAGTVILLAWGWLAPAGVPFALRLDLSGALWAAGLAGFTVCALFASNWIFGRLTTTAPAG